MSPSWSSRLLALPAARHIRVLALRERVVVSVSARGRPTVVWQAPLALRDSQPDLAPVAGWLAQTVGHGGRLDLLLSGAWLRADVLPWQPALLREQDARLLAADRLAHRFGEPATEWRITLGHAAPGRARLVCALPAHWYAAAGELARGGGYRLGRVAPLFTTAFDRVCRRLPADCLLAVQEPSRLTLARFDGGAWQGVHGRALPPEPDALLDLLAQGRALLGAHRHPLHVLTLGPPAPAPRDAIAVAWPAGIGEWSWLEGC